MDKKEIVLFTDGNVVLEVPITPEQDTVWLNRNQMAELFERDVKTIGKHVNNALKEELQDQTTTVMNQLKEVVRIMKRTEEQLDAKQILSVIEKYSLALELLDAYDHQNMKRP